VQKAGDFYRIELSFKVITAPFYWLWSLTLPVKLSWVESSRVLCHALWQRRMQYLDTSHNVRHLMCTQILRQREIEAKKNYINMVNNDLKILTRSK